MEHEAAKIEKKGFSKSAKCVIVSVRQLKARKRSSSRKADDRKLLVDAKQQK